MSRQRIIFQTEQLFVGASPSTGYNFVDGLGNFNNGPINGISGFSGTTTGIFNYNLLSSIDRVQSFSYSINTQKTDILALGKRGTISREDINSPTVDITFEYLQNGFLNEYRLGFINNFTIPFGLGSGTAFYPDNFAQSPISGFVDRNLIRSNNPLGYPYSHRDCRNLFLVNGPEGADLNLNIFSGVNPNDANLKVLSFGDCYINSYRSSAAVGDFPRANVGYQGYNLQVNFSGSGIAVPALNRRTRQPITGKFFTIPTNWPGTNPISVLLPGDITVDILSRPKPINRKAIDGIGTTGGYNPKILDLATDFTDYKIQSYELNLNLSRENLNAIGYKLPVDSQINFPVYANLSINTIVGDTQSGSLAEYLNKGTEYDVTIKMKNRRPGYQQGEIVRYDLRRALFNSVSYNDTLPNNKVGNFNFVAEFDPEDFSKGLFMSGWISDPLNYTIITTGTMSGTQTGNMNLLQGYLLQENLSYLTQEDGSKIIIQSYAFLG